MRKILILSQLLLMLFICNQIKAQYPSLEVKYSITAESSAQSGDAEILITVDGERPPFIFQLFNKAPWEGGKELMSSDKTSESQYRFTNLKNGEYLICVTDSEGNSKCEYVTIKNE